ncbi:MAG: hypothetical protein J5892_00595 [Bacilli bacterium]|nr:hypothetical protein [Bacilli bacterium]
MEEKNKAKTITLLSVLIGYSLIGNLNALEQNALGNFFMEIGQILETNAALEQAINTPTNTNINEKELIEKAIDKIKEQIKKY